MSLIKWTLAMAGTALGLRYMSDRHRRRAGGTDGSTQRNGKTIGGRPASQADNSSGTGLAGDNTGFGGDFPARSDDLLTPDTGSAPRVMPNRY